jgi:Domain of unknown function (DUF4190)
MSDTSQGPGWWLASDGKWYPPHLWTGPPMPGPPAAGPPPMSSPYVGGTPYGFATLGQRSRTNGLAIASIACSGAGLFLFGLSAVVGIIFGFVARSQIHKSNGTQTGSGLALAGIIVGFAVIALWVLFIALIVNSNSFHSCFSTSANANCGNS